jgi:hypothetical protein
MLEFRFVGRALTIFLIFDPTAEVALEYHVEGKAVARVLKSNLKNIRVEVCKRYQ